MPTNPLERIVQLLLLSYSGTMKQRYVYPQDGDMWLGYLEPHTSPQPQAPIICYGEQSDYDSCKPGGGAGL
jgi:hypothetical protein